MLVLVYGPTIILQVTGLSWGKQAKLLSGTARLPSSLQGGGPCSSRCACPQSWQLGVQSNPESTGHTTGSTCADLPGCWEEHVDGCRQSSTEGKFKGTMPAWVLVFFPSYHSAALKPDASGSQRWSSEKLVLWLRFHGRSLAALTLTKTYSTRTKSGDGGRLHRSCQQLPGRHQLAGFYPCHLHRNGGFHWSGGRRGVGILLLLF